MRLGSFHKKKRYYINKIKTNVLSLFLRKREVSELHSPLIKTCLLVHNNGKIGDLIVLSSLYRELEQRGVKLSIVTNGAGRAFLSGNKKIHQFYIKKSNKLRDIIALCAQLRAQPFDLVLDPFETMPSFVHSLLLFSVRAQHILGFDKCYRRYYTTYHPHDEGLTRHMCTRANEIFSQLYGAAGSTFDNRYYVPLPEEVEAKIIDFLGESQVIIINPLGAKKICRLTSAQISAIYDQVKESMPGYRILFTGLPADLRSIDLPHIETLPFGEFNYTVALTKHSRFVISVDTALVHIASAFEIPTLALYPNARHPTYPSHLIWSPNNRHAIQIVSPGCTVKDISPEVLRDAVDALFSKSVKPSPSASRGAESEAG